MNRVLHEGGSIAIRARRDDGRLHISVSDDGIGVRDEHPRERIGLANTRARLQRLYGDDQQLSFTVSPGGGFQVEMVIPFHETHPHSDR